AEVFPVKLLLPTALCPDWVSLDLVLEVDIQIISRFTVTHEDMSVHRQGLLSTQGNVYAMY
ncbi:Hypothetical predicted protein, partial [Marmota monax]